MALSFLLRPVHLVIHRFVCEPQFTAQQVNVGSPRPFAGYTNSDFAYFGLGVSQDFPYPGKLRLRGEMAKRDADVVQQQYESVRRSVLAGIKAAYFHLSYLSKMLGIFESDGQPLQQVEKAAEARYRAGMGNQHDLLHAQLERTKLLREIAMHHLEVAESQALIKHLLNRQQSSPDIEPADLSVLRNPFCEPCRGVPPHSRRRPGQLDLPQPPES